MSEETKSSEVVSEKEIVETVEEKPNEDIIDEDEYTQEDLIDEPVGHIKHQSVIGENEDPCNIIEEASESMKRTDGTKIWVIFNTFISILTLMLVVFMFATQMATPV